MDYCLLVYCALLQNTGGETLETESETAETAEEESTTGSYFVVGADDDNK